MSGKSLLSFILLFATLFSHAQNQIQTTSVYFESGEYELTDAGIMRVDSFVSLYSDFDIIRVGIIGTGSRGTGLASLIKDIRGMEVVACCDIIPEHLQNGLKEAAKGARAYTDYRKLLDDKTIHAVIIATPLYLHYPMSVDSA